MAYNGFYKYEGNILKWSTNKEYFLKMTGWDIEHPDRRVLVCEINVDKLKSISTSKALEKINTIWNSGISTWEYKDSKYDNSCMLDSFGSYIKIPIHEFKHTYLVKTVYDSNVHKYVNLDVPVEKEYTNEYKIVWHQGKVYWAISGQYFPRVNLAPLIDINVEPTNWVKWTNVKNCRGIVNVETNKVL